MKNPGWGPLRRKAAICLTFDNLAEAAEIEAGIWPSEKPLGRHESIVSGLPWVLEALAERPATFFVEGWSVARHPDAVRAIAAAGKEVALHGWRHEAWARVGGREKELLSRAQRALTELGLRALGFRPPGGPPAPSTFAHLAAEGYEYCSCVGTSSGAESSLAVLAYQWTNVDAFHLEPHLGGLRTAVGRAAVPATPNAMYEELRSTLASNEEQGGLLVLVWHPYLLINPDQRKTFIDTLQMLDGQDVWLASCAEIARFIKRNAVLASRAPNIDRAGWG